MKNVSFTERHVRRGIVSNQDCKESGWGMKAPFASVTCCGRAECVERAVAYIAASTNQPARYQEDS